MEVSARKKGLAYDRRLGISSICLCVCLCVALEVLSSRFFFCPLIFQERVLVARGVDSVFDHSSASSC